MTIEFDTRPLIVPAEPIPAPTQVELAEAEQADREQDDAEAKELLAKAGLDHVPTIDEAKALLQARREEIRHAVMLQADKRDWCEDGTRKVCANLRLERPGSRIERMVEVEMTLKFTIGSVAYTEEGALLKLKKNGTLSPKWIEGHLYVRNAQVNPTTVTIDGKPVDVSTLIEQKPEVTA